MKKLILSVKPTPPSPNRTLRMHWAVRRKVFKDIYDQVFWQVKQARWKGKGSVQISVERRSAVLMDPDNLIGSLKPVIDGLVRAGVMPDDKEEDISFGTIKQVKSKRKDAELIITVRHVE